MSSKTSSYAVFICVALAWVYPFAKEPVALAQYQIVACALLVSATFLYAQASLITTIGLLISWIILVFSPSEYRGETWLAMGATALAYCGFCLGTTRLTQGAQDVMVGTLIGATINALEGLLQYLGLAGGIWPWVPESLERGVAYGIFRQPNLFATLLCCGLACVVQLVLARKLSVGMAWLLVIVLHLGVAASGSRIGVVEAIAFAAVGLLWLKQQPRNISVLLVGQVAVLAAAAAVLPLLARLHGFEPRSLAQRLAHIPQDSRLAAWTDSVNLIAERPWFGWGWREFGYGHFKTLMEGRFNPDSILDNAHNTPLQLAVEFGLPLAALLCGLFVWAVLRAQPWKGGLRHLHAPWLIILSLSLHSMVEFPLWYAGFLFLGAMALGIVMRPEGFAGATNMQSIATKSAGVFGWHIVFSSWFPRLVALALLAFCWTGWTQYQKIVTIYSIPARLTAQRTAAIEEGKNAWLFDGAVEFAEFGLLELDKTPAELVATKAERLLHFSAEPRIVQALIFALWRQQKLAELQSYSARYCAAFPMAYARWVGANALMPMMEQVREHESECKLPKQALRLLTDAPPKN